RHKHKWLWAVPQLSPVPQSKCSKPKPQRCS
ncbi:hypothetical protein D027_2887B, partial [Vibrio parahaemolyticus 861]